MAGENQQQSRAPRPSTVVVTSENLAEYQAGKLNLEPTKPVESKPDEAPEKGEPGAKEAKANGAEEALEDERKAEKDPKRQRLNLRFSELTGQRNTAVNERDAARDEARREREARMALEAKVNADGAKGDKANEQPPADAKPDRTKFKAGAEGDAEYQDALIDWRVDQRAAQRERDDAAKQAAARDASVKATWAENVKAVRAVIPDYDAKIAASTVVVSDEVRDAMVTMEGEAGPRCLYYFAEFREEAERLAKMNRISALRELGKIEAKVMAGKAPKETQKDEEKAVSRAPKPAEPLKSTSGPDSLEDEKGNLNQGLSYKEYKAARVAGKIK
jgi:hypothetical protein